MTRRQKAKRALAGFLTVAIYSLFMLGTAPPELTGWKLLLAVYLIIPAGMAALVGLVVLICWLWEAA